VTKEQGNEQPRNDQPGAQPAAHSRENRPEGGQERPSPIAVLTQVTDALAKGGDTDTTLGRMLTTVGDAVGAPVVVLYLQDPDRVALQVALTIGLDDARRAEVERALADRTDTVWTVAHELTPTRATSGAFVAASGVAAAELRPLVIRRDGLDRSVGVLAVGWDDDHAATAEESALLDALAAACAVAVDTGRLASMIAERSEWFERMAHTDPLTGLANQRTFGRVLELELARAGRQGGEVSVAIFDIDGFTATNDEAGHEAGDGVLRSVASVLAESVRLVDTVARYGGDEFVVVAPGSAGVTVARRVLEGIAALQPLDGRRVTISAGVARFPDDGASADELLAAAQTALDQARAGGGGGISSATLGTG
jgi:diguanylate cyclase (GGDEF)-like protein